MVFLNHKKKYDNFCENSHFFEIHGQNWGVRRGRNWFKKTKIFVFFQPSSMCTIPLQVSLAYHYYLKSYGMCMLKLLKRHDLFRFFLTKNVFQCSYTKTVTPNLFNVFTVPRTTAAHLRMLWLRLRLRLLLRSDLKPQVF